MEVDQALRMKGGVGEASYAQNSFIQRKAISMAKPVMKEAIRNLHSFFPEAKSLSMADLGCSSGSNTFMVLREFIRTIRDVRREDGIQLPVDFKVFFNDLYGNDFNTIFKSLPAFRKQMENDKGDHLLAYGAPGSFYGRLFEPQTLHFVHCSYSLHYLSTVPNGVGRSNKRNISLSSSSPKTVVNAYYRQFQSDFSTFLKHRSEELVTGGCMVLTTLGRRNDHDRCSKEAGSYWHLIALALNQMVYEGMIEEEKLEVFNIPSYSPSPAEIEIEVKKEGSFVVNRCQVAEIEFAMANDNGNECSKDVTTKAHVGVVGCLRAVSESMLADHFGEGLMDQVYERLEKILEDRMANERSFVVSFTVSLTKIIRT